jgi:hypothetical protein
LAQAFSRDGVNRRRAPELAKPSVGTLNRHPDLLQLEGDSFLKFLTRHQISLQTNTF